MRSSLIAGDQLEEIILECRPQRRNRKNSRLAVSQLLQDGIQLHLGDFHAIAFPDFCGGSGERSWEQGPGAQFKENFHSIHFHRNNFSGRTDALQLSAEQHCYSVAQHFRIGENVGRKENSSSLTFKIENDVAHLAPSDWIKAGLWFVPGNDLRIVNDSLGSAHSLSP